MLSGNNSILSRAGEASKEATHADVYEQFQLKVADYYIGKNTGITTEETLIEYLQSGGSKRIISDELGEEGSGKYQIYVENLLGTTQKYGKGTASGSDTSTYKDVYILEKVETPEGASINNTKIASTNPIRIAKTNQATNYIVKYYGTEAGSSNEKILGNIWDTVGVSLSDIDKLKAYFNGKTYDDVFDDNNQGKDNVQIGINGNDLSYIMESDESEDGKYNYLYIKYKNNIYKVKGNNSNVTYTDDIVEATLTGTKGLCKIDDHNVFVIKDGLIIPDYVYEEIEDEEYGNTYKINREVEIGLDFSEYYKQDGTLVAFGIFEVDKGMSTNIKEDFFINQVYETVEDEELEYTSKDTSIATVDNEGNVTGIENGNTKITVKGKTSGKTIDVIVNIRPGLQ